MSLLGFRSRGFLLHSMMAAVVLAPAGRQDEIVEGPIAKTIDDHLSRLVPFGFSGAVLLAKGDTVSLARGYGVARSHMNEAVS